MIDVDVSFSLREISKVARAARSNGVVVIAVKG